MEMNKQINSFQWSNQVQGETDLKQLRMKLQKLNKEHNCKEDRYFYKILKVKEKLYLDHFNQIANLDKEKENKLK